MLLRKQIMFRVVQELTSLSSPLLNYTDQRKMASATLWGSSQFSIILIMFPEGVLGKLPWVLEFKDFTLIHWTSLPPLWKKIFQ